MIFEFNKKFVFPFIQTELTRYLSSFWSSSLLFGRWFASGFVSFCWGFVVYLFVVVGFLLGGIFGFVCLPLNKEVRAL